MNKKVINCCHKWSGTKINFNNKEDKQIQIDRNHKEDFCKKCKVKLFDYIKYTQDKLGVSEYEGKFVDKRIAPGA